MENAFAQGQTAPRQEKLLEISGLTVTFGGSPVILDLHLEVEPGKTVCLVGESGSGKSMTALSILRLVPEPGKISGQIKLLGHDVTSLKEAEMCQVRGRQVSMVFQEPMTSLNPVLRIGAQVAEPLREHEGLSKQVALEKAAELLQLVGIPAAKSRLNDYPHQLSGGMRQRVMIAMALACSPRLLLADEPTTALDVTIQGQILRLLKSLSKERDMGLLLITHDLGVVAEMADQVGVMYAGELLETADADKFFAGTLHPYAQGLKECAPTVENRNMARLSTIAGTVPSPSARPQGCVFRPRCPKAFERCHEHPAMQEAAPGHKVRCWLYADQVGYA